MIIMPAVDIKNGKCVQLVQGKPGTEQIVLDNPAEVAMEWEEKGASVLHVIDLGGALEEEGNIPVVREIVQKVSVPVQMGGGIRNVEDATRLLNMGVDRIILGTLAIESPETVELLSDQYGSERIMVALDSKDSQVVVRGWTEKTNQTAPQLGEIMEEKGAGGLLFTNVDHEGLLGGFKIQPLLKLLETVNIPVVYSGGVSTLEDIKTLSQTDVYGVVIGSALYKGTLNLEDALSYEEK